MEAVVDAGAAVQVEGLGQVLPLGQVLLRGAGAEGVGAGGAVAHAPVGAGGDQAQVEVLLGGVVLVGGGDLPDPLLGLVGAGQRGSECLVGQLFGLREQRLGDAAFRCRGCGRERAAPVCGSVLVGFLPGGAQQAQRGQVSEGGSGEDAGVVGAEVGLVGGAGAAAERGDAGVQAVEGGGEGVVAVGPLSDAGCVGVGGVQGAPGVGEGCGALPLCAQAVSGVGFGDGSEGRVQGGGSVARAAPRAVRWRSMMSRRSVRCWRQFAGARGVLSGSQDADGSGELGASCAPTDSDACPWVPGVRLGRHLADEGHAEGPPGSSWPSTPGRAVKRAEALCSRYGRT